MKSEFAGTSDWDQVHRVSSQLVNILLARELVYQIVFSCESKSRNSGSSSQCGTVSELNKKFNFSMTSLKLRKTNTNISQL